MPRTTVVIPVYNRAESLRRSVESVLAQTADGLEVVVVDDGSDEVDVSAVVDEFDGPVECVTHQTNRGAAAARNTGLDHANGEYVAFLDSDDYWHPKKVEAQLHRLESHPRECVAVYCGTEWEDATWSRRVASKYLHGPEGVEGDTAVLRALAYPNSRLDLGSTLLAERSAVDAVGQFDTGLDRHEEIEFGMRLARKGCVAYVDEPLAVVDPSPSPPADVLADSKRRLAEHFRREFTDVIDVGRANASHRFQLARWYVRGGAFRVGISRLSDARPHAWRQYVLLVYSFLRGLLGTLRRRWQNGGGAT